jgi:DNA-directed RNA polymerase III subunit RPC8
LIEQIEAKYANKIILNVGLGILFYDFLHIGEPYLYPGSGSSIQIVRFRLVVFRPFVGEVLVGRVISSNKESVKVSLDFFDDIIIPHTQLQHPSTFNPMTSLWVWKYEAGAAENENENGDPVFNEFPLNIGDEVRFKVRTISFTELTASAKGLTATTTTESRDLPKASDSSIIKPSSSSVGGNSVDTTVLQGVPLIRRRSSSMGVSSDEEMPSAMQIIGSMNDFGLGSLTWW